MNYIIEVAIFAVVFALVYNPVRTVIYKVFKVGTK